MHTMRTVIEAKKTHVAEEDEQRAVQRAQQEQERLQRQAERELRASE